MDLVTQRLSQVRSSRPPAPEHIALLARLVAEGVEEDLFRINPLQFAQTHGMGEQDAIDLLLHAASAGVFEFSWDETCPGCGGILKSSDNLHQVLTDGFCAICWMPAEFSLDELIRVTFTVSPSIRPLRFHRPEEIPWGPDLRRVFFSMDRTVPESVYAGMLDCYRVVETTPARQRWQGRINLEPREHRFVNLSAHLGDLVAVEGEPAAEPQALRMEIRDGGVTIEPRTLRPGPVDLEVTNFGTDCQTWALIVEPDYEGIGFKPEYYGLFRDGLTGKRLLNCQSFRELYRTETLVPGASLSLRSLTFCFTDLTGSTEMYDRLGDLTAYRLVREHFAILTDIVAGHGGAIVKTIGDAIMATFTTPLDAVKASVEMHRRIEEWNRQHEADDLTLKIGIHEGPCIAVDSNDRLDYFGHTVNMAARVQGLAKAKETYLSAAVLSGLGVQAFVEANRLDPDARTTQLKGISEEALVYRLALA